MHPIPSDPNEPLVPLFEYFKRYQALNTSQKKLLKELIPVHTVPKDSILLEADAISSEFYFVLEGCIRLFYLVDGQEKTTFFYTEHQFVSSYESFTKQQAAGHYFQTLEASKIAVISLETAQTVLQAAPVFGHLARIIMEEELSIYQRMLASFITMNASQRYTQLQEQHPELIQRIPQYHLATYLGVSPETLSRIRRRLHHKRSHKRS